MTQRAIIGLTPDAKFPSVRRRLSAAGAEEVQAPTPELPDVSVVTLSSERNLAEFLEKARSIPGVRYAEADVWRTT